MVQAKGVFYPEEQEKKKSVGSVASGQIPHREVRISQPSAQNLPPELDTYIQKMKTEEKLKSLVQQSNDVLFKCRTVFPFDFFPDSLIIDKTKVNIINKIFFLSEDVHSILIKNIKDVEVTTNVFFATIQIIPDVYLGQTTTVSYLKKSDALEARRLIQGLVLCQREEVDIAPLDSNELKDRIEHVGTAVDVRYAR